MQFTTKTLFLLIAACVALFAVGAAATSGYDSHAELDFYERSFDDATEYDDELYARSLDHDDEEEGDELYARALDNDAAEEEQYIYARSALDQVSEDLYANTFYERDLAGAMTGEEHEDDEEMYERSAELIGDFDEVEEFEERSKIKNFFKKIGRGLKKAVGFVAGAVL